MNNKKAKLIRKVANKFKGSYSSMKRNYVNLSKEDKKKVSDKMKVLIR